MALGWLSEVTSGQPTDDILYSVPLWAPGDLYRVVVAAGLLLTAAVTSLVVGRLVLRAVRRFRWAFLTGVAVFVPATLLLFLPYLLLPPIAVAVNVAAALWVYLPRQRQGLAS